MLSRLINRPCELILRTDSDETDAHGNKIRLESLIETVCELQQTQSVEPPAADEMSQSTFNVYLLPGTEPNTGDALIVEDLTYEFVGQPWAARNPRTRTISHIQGVVKRTAGSDREITMRLRPALREP